MRLHQVTSRLFTGPKMDHDQRLWCHEIGITHHLNVAQEVSRTDLSQQPVPNTLALPIYDREKDITDSWIGAIMDIGLDILSDTDHRLLITCLQGQNRSPSAAYAVLRAFGLPQAHSKALSKGGTAPKYAHIIDRYVDRVLNLP